MSNIGENFKRKRHERRNQKASTWTNLIIKIILLIFVIMIIRNLSQSKKNIFHDIFKKKSNQTEALK